jgi:hypothetical protein
MQVVKRRRIDYVRLRMPSDGLDKAAQVADWAAAVDDLCAQAGKSRKCYGFDMYYDHGLKRKIPYFQVWGEMADVFFDTLRLNELHALMRLDYRETILEEPADWDELFFMLKKRNREKVQTKMLTGSKRSKEGGRDTGGEYIAMGAEGSFRRVSIYERAAEGPVWEFQCVGQGLRDVVQRAFAQGVPFHKTPHGVLRHALEAEAYKYFAKYTGFEPAMLDSGLPTQRGIADYTDPEHYASQLSLFWDAAPAEVREAFLQEKGSFTEHAAARAVDAELFVNEADWQETYNEVDIEALNVRPDRETDALRLDPRNE